MRVVHVTEQQVDRDRFGPQRNDSPAQLRQIVLGQRLDDVAVWRDPPAGADEQLVRYGVGRGARGEAIQIATRLASDPEHVGETAIGDIRSAHPFAFEGCIRGDGAAVHDCEASCRNVRIEPEIGDSAADRQRRILGRRHHLVQSQTAVIEQHEVGKCASGVDAE